MAATQDRGSPDAVPDAAEVRERIAAVTSAAGEDAIERVSTAALLRRVIDDAQALIDKQVELAKQELREEVGQALQAGRTLGIGAGLLFVALICSFHVLFLGIDTLFPRWGWLAALVVAVACGAAGAVLVQRGRRAMKLQPLARTRATLKEDADWAKQLLRRNGRSP